MKVLIACEESQRVCTAFRERGHEAYSCDVQEPSGGHPEWHILGDALAVLNPEHIERFGTGILFRTVDGRIHFIRGRWDLIIAHPPCTYLTSAGGNRLKVGGKIQQERYFEGLAAKEFFMRFLNADCDRIAVENPAPLRIFALPHYTQIIEPYMFGDPWKKRTCLWLKGLPKLMPDDPVQPLGCWVSCAGRNNRTKLRGAKGVRSRKERSKTFPGIARAMAEQWGGAL